MAEQFDVIVAGLGAFGACACEALARRGARVLGLDRHGIPHALGSSHGAARAIRLCYYEHPDYVPLLQLAYRAWGDLARRSGVEVTTARRRCRASRLVLCAGPWTRRLLPDLGLPLAVTRQVQGWIWPRRPELFTPDRFPIWGFEEPGEPFNYGFPLLPDRPGVKVARHEPGPPADPDGIDRAIGRRDLEAIRAAAARLPDASGPILTASTCMYTNTPDGHFVVDVHPDTDRVVIACGFSGHGLKFASGMGEILADLALDGGTEHPIEFLRLGRFDAARPAPPASSEDAP